ncbi:MAG: DUF2330 domain-containing protein, partial [Planctomycetota bacterium]
MRRLAVSGLVLLVTAAAWADRGSIPFKPHVKVFEPTQRAMIAWNGEEEILLLSTDLRASAETKVLEVLPLPAEPKVKKGSLKTFQTATTIINRHLARSRKLARASKDAGGGGAERPAGEVTFHKKIGPHEISVTRVLDGPRFVTWVQGCLAKQGVPNAVMPDGFREIVEGYIKGGFGWFVFDVVSLDAKVKTIEPIQYRFATRSLFYPLRITMLDHGNTSIDLIVLTPRLLRTFPGLPVKRVKLKHPPITISDLELRSISKEMYELLGRRPSMKLRIWNCSGPLASFDRD